jgi:hypothetical protein
MTRIKAGNDDAAAGYKHLCKCYRFVISYPAALVSKRAPDVKERDTRMLQQRSVRCTNCGTEWTPAPRVLDQGGASTGADACPVCHLPLSTSDTAPTDAVSVDDLANQLGEFIAEARASGLDADAIVQVLRDELEFAAEMAHTGRRFFVQLIDLGPQESTIVQRPVRDRREMLQSRSVN